MMKLPVAVLTGITLLLAACGRDVRAPDQYNYSLSITLDGGEPFQRELSWTCGYSTHTVHHGYPVSDEEIHDATFQGAGVPVVYQTLADGRRLAVFMSRNCAYLEKTDEPQEWPDASWQGWVLDGRSGQTQLYEVDNDQRAQPKIVKARLNELGFPRLTVDGNPLQSANPLPRGQKGGPVDSAAQHHQFTTVSEHSIRVPPSAGTSTTIEIDTPVDWAEDGARSYPRDEFIKKSEQIDAFIKRLNALPKDKPTVFLPTTPKSRPIDVKEPVDLGNWSGIDTPVLNERTGRFHVLNPAKGSGIIRFDPASPPVNYIEPKIYAVDRLGPPSVTVPGLPAPIVLAPKALVWFPKERVLTSFVWEDHSAQLESAMLLFEQK